MTKREMNRLCLVAMLICLATLTASAQSFQVQCPSSTITHPDQTNAGVNNSEPLYVGPTVFADGPNGYLMPTSNVNGAIKCQQISGGDGFATMGDGTQTYLFAFGPLSGLKDMADGKPGTQFPNVFNTMSSGLQPGDPAASLGITAGTWPGFPISTTGFSYNGAVGLAPDADAIAAGLCTAPCLMGTSIPARSWTSAS